MLLVRSATVSVAVQKMGALFFHPIGNTSGYAIRGFVGSLVGNMTPRRGMSCGDKLIL